MDDPGRGVRCAIRDTGATGSGRYDWTVTVFGGTDLVAARRTRGQQRRDHGRRRRYALMQRVASRPVAVRALLANASLTRLYWRALDASDYG
jgi:hypothetical protein